MMQRRPVGRTGLELSVVGLGSEQLQLLTRTDAINTLRRGFSLGVNWVHAAPDYGETEPLIARAIAESGREVHVLTQGPGPLSLLEPHFENICTLFGRNRLAMYGIGCIDDLERVGENVWGAAGMIEFLNAKKREGRLGGVFCTTHGTAEYVTRLVRSGVFDAIMVACNPIGFHLLTYNPPPEEGRAFEHIPDVRAQVFPLAAERGVAIFVMKALGGGLLAHGRAFPPHEWFAAPAPPLAAADLIKYVLSEPAVCATVVGVASPEEAEEDARAGHAPLELSDERRRLVDQVIARMRLTLCSRCGACESTCSKRLPISFMFRDAYIWNYRTATFMADDRFAYFRMHPDDTLACATCVDRTCVCPQGIEIPKALERVHTRIGHLVTTGAHPGRIESDQAAPILGAHGVKVLTSEFPTRMGTGAPAVARFLVQNCSSEMWCAPQYRRSGALAIVVEADGRRVGSAPLRTNVSPGQRSHLVVELRSPRRSGRYAFRVLLAPLANGGRTSGATPFHQTSVVVEPGPSGNSARRLARRGVRLARHVVAKFRSNSGRVGEVQRPSGPAYGARYVEHTIPSRLRSAVTGGYRVTIENTGITAWRSFGDQAVEANIIVDDTLYAVLPMPRDNVASGESVTLHFAFQPPSHEGRHRVKIDLVQRPGVRFSLEGVNALALDVDVEKGPDTRTTRAAEQALAHNLWYYQPTSGIDHGRDGRSYPLFVTKANGCRVWDAEDREYIDYTMSWGATILGHADERIQSAVRRKLESGALPPFPDPVEMDVSHLLAEDFPSGEMVVFGKNGSDVCTVAARLARLVTGRRVILSCGFHGWQDFALGYFSFAESGIPRGPEAFIYKFRFNDRRDFFQLYHKHRGDLAAVMIEPAGPFGGAESGMGGDADPEFLGEIADAARSAQALLIFDEIITGYRYPSGSVQRATGIVPDLTCLGKALASGFPLSALVGKSRIFHAGFARTHYCPTFKGEVYSFVAAKAAIEIYRTEPITQHIWRHGEGLREGINRIGRDLHLAVECKGPPFRMGIHFPEHNALTARLKRTLFMQELLKEGIITVTGVMLPSYAHDHVVMRRTLDAIGAALEVVASAELTGDYDRLIEIPLL